MGLGSSGSSASSSLGGLSSASGIRSPPEWPTIGGVDSGAGAVVSGGLTKNGSGSGASAAPLDSVVVDSSSA